MRHGFSFAALSLCLACAPAPDDRAPRGTFGDLADDPANDPTRPTNGPWPNKPSTDTEALTAGSRLRPAWYDGSDGSRQFATWYDSQLEVDCAFRSVNGTAQCVPNDVLTLHESSETGRFDFGFPFVSTDPTCAEFDVVKTALDGCLEYGVLHRISVDTNVGRSTLTCDLERRSEGRYYHFTEVDTAATPLYYFGIPDGGGACCDCYPFDPANDLFNNSFLLLGDYVDESTTPFVTARVSVE